MKKVALGNNTGSSHTQVLGSESWVSPFRLVTLGNPCLYFHIYCMSGTGDRDRISILKKPQLTEFLIWAGPLEQSGFLNRN